MQNSVREHTKILWEILKMSISRKLGTLVVFGVPAIIGGGIVYALFDHSYVAVSVFETVLILTAGAFVSR